MSGKRLAVLAAAGQAGESHNRSGPDGLLPPTTYPAHLRGGERPPPPLNLLLTSAVLGGLMAAVCAACYCCSRTARGKSRRPPASSTSSHNTISSRPIYTLPQECEHHSLCYESGGYLPPYRRPPTPGPPPAYDSVVGRNDKLRHFGIDDEYTEDDEKIHKYYLHESLGPEELMMANSDSMADMETLKFCIANRKNENDDKIKIHCPANCDRQIKTRIRQENKNSQREERNRDFESLERKREVVFTIAGEDSGSRIDGSVDGAELYRQESTFCDETVCSTSAVCEIEPRICRNEDESTGTHNHAKDTDKYSTQVSKDGDTSPASAREDSVHQQERFAESQEESSEETDGAFDGVTVSDEALPTYEAAMSSHKNYHFDNV